MPNHSSKEPKRPRDINQLAKFVVDLATGEPHRLPGPEQEASPIPQDREKDPAAVSLGRRGGLKGGKARAEKMTKKELSESARNAANARWGNKSDQDPKPEGWA